MSTPTPEQLATADLVEIPAPKFVEAISNGYPLRSYNEAQKDFPPIGNAYVSTAYATAKPVPVPPAPPAPLPPTPPTGKTFTATQVGTNQITVTWAGFSPIQISRSGSDSNGTGAWNTGTLSGEPTIGTFTFNDLIPGDVYVLTVTETGGATITTSVTLAGSPVVTPPVTPPSGTYASGLSIPASLPGTTRLFTDFKNGIDSSFWTTPYDGTSNPGGGRFMATHCKVVNGVLTIEAYQDSAANDPGANNWGGGGIQTQQRYPVGTTFYSVVRKDTYANWFAIQLLMGDNWPPEDDYEETTTSNSDTESIHYSSSNQQIQAQKSGLDLTDWGLWVHTWTAKGIVTTLTVAGATTQIASMSLPDTNASDPNSDVQPMFYSFQMQTESGSTLTDPNVTASNPVKFQLEQFAAFVPA